MRGPMTNIRAILHAFDIWLLLVVGDRTAVIAGTLAIVTLYMAIRPAFGRIAAVSAALALALIPSSVVIDSRDEPDSLQLPPGTRLRECDGSETVARAASGANRPLPNDWKRRSCDLDGRGDGVGG